MIVQPIVWLETKIKIIDMSKLTEYLKTRIAELEDQIKSNTGDLDSLRKELDRIQRLEMEEDLRHSDNQRLLQG